MSSKLAAHFRAARLHDKKAKAARTKLLARSGALSDSELATRMRALKVPCGRCKGESSLKFSRSGRQLSITCDAEGQCATNRTMDRGAFVLLPDVVRSADQELASLMSAIVALKLKRAHGLVDKDASIDQFEGLRDKIATTERRRDKATILLREQTGSEARREEVPRLEAALRAERAAIVEDLRTWRATGSSAALRAGVERYAQSARPLSLELGKAMYAYRAVVDDDGVRTLVQDPSTLDQLDVSVDKL
jgi:hypothetical protein